MGDVYDLTNNIPEPSEIKAGDILNCPYSGTSISISLPAGSYKLECWGAQGGGWTNNIGGNGGYSTGILTLSAQNTIYICTLEDKVMKLLLLLVQKVEDLMVEVMEIGQEELI